MSIYFTELNFLLIYRFGLKTSFERDVKRLIVVPYECYARDD